MRKKYFRANGKRPAQFLEYYSRQGMGAFKQKPKKRPDRIETTGKGAITHDKR